MHAHAEIIREGRTAVYGRFYDHRGVLRTVPVVVTSPEHARQVVAAVNAAPATGNFPAVLAAVAARGPRRAES